MRLGVSYIPSHLPHHIEEDLAELVEIGCKDVLFAIQENHLVTLEGVLRFGPDLALKAGLRPQAVIWGFANTFGGGTISKIMLDNPSLWRLKADGTREAKACLKNPALFEHLYIYAKKLVEAGFELIIVDEPTKQECFCEHCKKSFTSLFGGHLEYATDADDYEIFRKKTTIDYTSMACRTFKRVSKDLETACCLMHIDRDCWEETAKIEELDMLGTDPYWLVPICNLTLDEALHFATTMKDICREYRKKSQVWLNCWGIPKGVEEEIYKGGKQLAEITFDSFFTWSYRGGLGTNEECARSDIAWQHVVRLYRELSAQ